MSIKPVLSFRGVLVGAIAVIILGIAAFAFGERSYSAIFTSIFTAEAAEQTAGGTVSASGIGADRPDAEKNGRIKPRSDLFGTDRIIVGQGNGLGYISGDRRDKVQVIQPTGTPSVLTGIDDFEPQWSADGKKVVFVSLRDAPPSSNYYTRHDYRSIYIMNADGSDQTRIFTQSFLAPMQPTFSPDGRQLAFTLGLGTSSQVYVVDLDGKNARRVTTGKGPNWHPLWLLPTGASTKRRSP